MRTLDVLRNLSKKEAENFVKLGNYILRSGEKAFYIDPQAFISTKDGGLSFLEILALKDAGLIFPTDLEFTFSEGNVGETSNLLYDPLILMFEREKETQKFGSRVGLLTRVGVELLQLLTVQPDMECVELVGKRFSAEGVRLGVFICAITSIRGLHGSLRVPTALNINAIFQRFSCTPPLFLSSLR